MGGRIGQRYDLTAPLADNQADCEEYGSRRLIAGCNGFVAKFMCPRQKRGARHLGWLPDRRQGRLCRHRCCQGSKRNDCGPGQKTAAMQNEGIHRTSTQETRDFSRGRNARSRESAILSTMGYAWTW